MSLDCFIKMMPSSGSEPFSVESLAEDYLGRLRHGEHPSMDEYTERFPALAEEIRQFFPALRLVENFKPDSQDGEVARDRDGRRHPSATSLDAVPNRLGDFRILREVSRGGMGVVYEAVQESLGRPVALKVLPRHALLDARQRQRFVCEARAAASLHHTNIVPVFGVGEFEGVHYYAMQFIQGLSLDQVLVQLGRVRADELRLTPGCDSDNDSRDEPLAPLSLGSSVLSTYCHSIARIGVQVADALQHAHDQGILHRDIKPSNLLLDARGTAWITDFGLAKAEGQGNLTRTGDVVGTLRYMAPEVFHGKAESRSDVFSLGLTLYELLAKRPAFDESNRHKLIRQVLHESPAGLRTFDRGIPRDLETIIHKAIDRDPARRYQTAREMADDLQRFLADEPIRARRTFCAVRLVRWCRRNPGIAASMATIALLLLVVSMGGIAWAIHAESARREIASVENESAKRLFESYVVQANASRVSRRPGQRLQSLASLRRAARLIPRLGIENEMRRGLRNEAIAAMGLIDLAPDLQFELPVRDKWVTFDASMSRYACTDVTHQLRIHRVSDHRSISRLPKRSPPTNTIWRRFTSSGCYLIGAGGSRCWVWDTVREEITLELDIANNLEVVDSASFSCRGDQLAVIAPDKTVHLYHIPTAKHFQTLATDAQSVFLSSDGSMAAVAFGEKIGVQIWDCRTGRPLRVFAVPSVYSMAWSTDGQLLACGVENDFDILIWNIETGTLCTEMSGHQNGGFQLCFSHDNSVLASTSWDGTARLWEPMSGRELLRCAGGRCDIRANDKLVLNTDTSVNTWRLIQSSECRTLRAFDNRQGIHFQDCDFWWGGPLLACARGDGLRIWDPRSNRELAFAPIGRTASVQFHEGTGSLITSGSAGIYQWPIQVSGDSSAWIIGPPRKLLERAGGQRGESNLAQNNDGNRIVAVVDHDSAIAFTLGSASRTAFDGHTDICRLSVSADGRWVASGTNFGVGVRIWNAETGQMVRDIWPECFSGAVSFSPDDRTLAAWNANELRIFDTQRWQLSRGFSLSSLGQSMAWSTTGLWFVHSVEDRVRLIDARSGTELATFTSPNEAGNVESICLSPTNRRLAIVYRNAVEVWDLFSVRRHLAEMELDWHLPATALEPATQTLPQRVEFDLGDFAAESPQESSSGAAVQQARLYSLSGHWQQAALHYERAYECGTTDVEYLFEVAAGLLIVGRDDYFDEVCRATLQRHHNTDDGRTAYVIARMAALDPARNADVTVHRLATTAVESAAGTPWYEHTLGLVYYRENNLEQARFWLEKSSESNWEANVANWISLAMVHHGLGNADQREFYWGKATEWLKKPLMLHPHDRAAVKLLSDEAEELLSKRPSPAAASDR